LARIHQLVSQGAQLIISTHSPILMSYPDASILVLDADGTRCSRLEDTEHYAVTKAILQDPRGMLERLLGELDQ
jgi:predicted ATPase